MRNRLQGQIPFVRMRNNQHSHIKIILRNNQTVMQTLHGLNHPCVVTWFHPRKLERRSVCRVNKEHIKQTKICENIVFLPVDLFNELLIPHHHIVIHLFNTSSFFGYFLNLSTLPRRYKNLRLKSQIDIITS